MNTGVIGLTHLLQDFFQQLGVIWPFSPRLIFALSIKDGFFDSEELSPVLLPFSQDRSEPLGVVWHVLDVRKDNLRTSHPSNTTSSFNERNGHEKHPCCFFYTLWTAFGCLAAASAV